MTHRAEAPTSASGGLLRETGPPTCPPRPRIALSDQREGGSPNGLRKLPAREEAPAAGACPAPALPALPWRPPAPTGGLGEKIGAPPPLGGFRPNPPRGGFPPIRRWWARVGFPPLSLIGLAGLYISCRLLLLPASRR